MSTRDPKTGRRYDAKRVQAFLAEKSALRNPKLVEMFAKLGAAAGIATAPGESVIDAIVSWTKAMERVNDHRKPGERAWTEAEILGAASKRFGIPAPALKTTLATVQHAVLKDMALEQMARRDFALPDSADDVAEKPAEENPPADDSKSPAREEQRTDRRREMGELLKAAEAKQPPKAKPAPSPKPAEAESRPRFVGEALREVADKLERGERPEPPAATHTPIGSALRAAYDSKTTEETE